MTRARLRSSADARVIDSHTLALFNAPQPEVAGASPEDQMQACAEVVSHVVLAENANPLGAGTPALASSTAPLCQSSGMFSSTAVPSRQDLNDSRPVLRFCHGVGCLTLAMN